MHHLLNNSFHLLLQATCLTCLMMMPSCVLASTVPTGVPTWWPPPCLTWTSSNLGLLAPLSWSPLSWTTAMVSVCWISLLSHSHCPSPCPGQSMMLTISVAWPLVKTPSTALTWAPLVQLCGALWLHPMVCSCAKPRTSHGLMGHPAGMTATAWLGTVSLRARPLKNRYDPDLI